MIQDRGFRTSALIFYFFIRKIWKTRKYYLYLQRLWEYLCSQIFQPEPIINTHNPNINTL